MLRKIYLSFLASVLMTLSPLAAYHPSKVVLWGHKLHSHTHSYIHWGFYRAFQHLGYEVLWLDNTDDVSKFDFSGALFITEGQVNQKLPLRADCRYILHNCVDERCRKFQAENNNWITLQVYTHDCKERDLTEMAKFVLYNVEERIMYMPWATDLLPHEVEANKRNLPKKRDKNIYFVGSVSGGEFGNMPQVQAFKSAAAQKKLHFQLPPRGISMEENIKLIRHSYLAPALQGAWQCRQGYIPCRIFKNISYGAMGITNSAAVQELFDGKLIYNARSDVLFDKSYAAAQSLPVSRIIELMDIVKNNHTYITRIEQLFEFIDMTLGA